MSTSSVRAHTRQPLPKRVAFARGLLGWFVMCTGLGIAIGVPAALEQHFGLPRIVVIALQATLMSAIVIPLIILLRTRLDRRSLAGLGWGRPARALLIGAGVGVATAVLVWAPAIAAGWIRVTDIEPTEILSFLLVNGVIIVLYEALPEELALRGYVWSNLRDGWGTAAATVFTTAIFPFGGIVISSVAWVTTAVLGGEAASPSFFPAGMDPIVYVVQLALFGLALVAARRIPIAGALFIAVAFHATQLTVNRMVLGGTSWHDAGMTTTFVVPDAIALVLVHIVLAGVTFIAIRRTLTRRITAQSPKNEP